MVSLSKFKGLKVVDHTLYIKVLHIFNEKNKLLKVC